MHDMPAGNILFSRKSIVNTMELYPNISCFDLASLALIIKSCYSGESDSDKNDIAFCPQISSLHIVSKQGGLRDIYNEYDYIPAPWDQGRQRDKSLLQAFNADGAVVKALFDKYNQASSNKSGDNGSMHELDPKLFTEKVSQHISLKIYFEQILKNRPFLKKAFLRVHAGLARLLRLH